MKFKRILVTKRGSPEVLQIVENELRPPKEREVRIKTLAAFDRMGIIVIFGVEEDEIPWLFPDPRISS